jgi:serine/threonine-protein kinase RsbW
MDFAATVATRMGFPRARVDDIRTVVAEATINAIEHGNALDPSRSVVLCLAPCCDGLEIRIKDHCPRPVLCDAARPRLDDKLSTTSPHRGWGLFLIRALADDVEFTSTRHGNTLRMRIAPRCDTSATDA